jgi:hypothetical protein
MQNDNNKTDRDAEKSLYLSAAGRAAPLGVFLPGLKNMLNTSPFITTTFPHKIDNIRLIKIWKHLCLAKRYVYSTVTLLAKFLG